VLATQNNHHHFMTIVDLIRAASAAQFSQLSIIAAVGVHE
jgi:hypothetical protein